MEILKSPIDISSAHMLWLPYNASYINDSFLSDHFILELQRNTKKEAAHLSVLQVRKSKNFITKYLVQ